MNIINHWANIIKESTECDDCDNKDKKETEEKSSEETVKEEGNWLDDEHDKDFDVEEIKKQLQQIKDYEEKHKNDNPDDLPDDPNYKSIYDDPEFRETLKKIDSFLNSQNGNGGPAKKVFVYQCVSVFEPSNDPKTTGKFTADVKETKEFDTLDEAKKYLSKIMKENGAKYGAKLEDFKAVPDGALPTEIRKQDPDAIGFIYQNTEGEGRTRVTQGVRTDLMDDPDNEDNYDHEWKKITKETFMEYFVYTSTAKIAGKSKLDDLFKDMAKSVQK